MIKDMVTGHRVRIPTKQRVWKDPRFVIGVVLIAISVIGCSLMVSHARGGVAIYQTTKPVPVGEPLGPSNTTVVVARPQSDAYVLEGQLQSGAIATRSIAGHELLPTSAVGPADDMNLRRMVVSVSALPSSVQPGDRLELWFAPDPSLTSAVRVQAQSGEENRGSHVVASPVVVVETRENAAGIGQNATMRVEIAVPASAVGAILDANEQPGTLSALPMGTK